jgi:hypothetical protein
MFFRSGANTARVLLNVSNVKDFKRDEIYMELVRAVEKLSIKRFSSVITPLLKDQRVQENLPYYRASLESMTSSNYFHVRSTDRLFEYYYLIIKAQAEKINQFIIDRKTFERLIFCAEYEQCEQFLENFKKAYGESVWWIKSTLLVLFYKQNSDKTQEFCDDILGRTGNCLFTYYLNSLIQCTHASSPLADLERKITKAIEEFDKADIPAVSWFVQKLCFPEILSRKDEDLENLHLLQKLPVIDIYHFTTSSVLLYATTETTSPEKNKACGKFINALVELVDDERLKNSSSGVKREVTFSSNLERQIVIKYDSGLYLEVLEIVEKNINEVSDPLGFANIVAKSCIRTGTPFSSGRHIFDDTVKNLIDIHSLSTRASQARLELQERIIRLNGTELGTQLQAVLATAIPQFFSEPVLIKILKVASLTQKTLLPLAKSLIDNGRNVYGDDYRFLDPLNVTSEREARCHSPRLDPPRERLDGTGMSEKSLPILKKDFIEYTARHLAYTQQLCELVDFASSCLTEHPECYICFPMDEMLKHVETSFMHSMEAVIVCHFYVRFISSKKRTLLNEIFEEYLYSSGKVKPSELFEELQSRERSLELLFFNEVCSFESLDFLDSFQNSDELRAERANIIENLYNRKLISRESYSKELEQIVRLVVLDTATSNFSRSKIYVDQVSIKRKIKEEITTYFELYQITKKTEQAADDGLFIFSERTSDNETFASGVMSGQQSSLLVKIIELVHRAFLFDEAFGLDANLSAEIRHGIFSNFMLSEVDSKHLISEKNDDETYKPISHWHEFYSSWVVPTLLRQLDKNFAWFSEQFNELIDHAERWMKIGYGKAELCFDFSINTDDYAQVKGVAINCDSVDNLIDEIFAILWEKTETGLIDLKDRINSKFKHDIEKLFTELTSRITTVKGNAVLNEIMTNIETANNNTKEIIAEITEWFARSESKVFDDQTLIQLIDISVSCFERIKGRKLKVSRNLSLDIAGFWVPGQYVNSMILAIVNLLTNAIRHSGLETNVDIYISAIAIEKGYQIRISNTLSDERFLELDESFFISINDSFNSPESLELLRQEGGTGLAKAFHHLKTAHPGFDLKVLLTDRTFCTEVNYVNVDFIG